MMGQAKRLINISALTISAFHPRWWIAFGKLISRRTQQQQLPQVAASLTFTTVLSLVPLVTVALAIFTAFPMFDRARAALQGYLFESFLPDTLSDTILNYVNQFSSKAKGLTAFGLLGIVITALTTMFTVDRVFNEIWHVKRGRSLVKKIILYWSVITLSPLLVGASISMSSYVINLSISGISSIKPLTSLMFSVAPLLLTAAAFALLYQTIPNRPVLWQDAAIGGVVAALLFEVSKRAFAYFITHFPTYTAVYGALAAFPIFLLWIYMSWIVVLLGATVAAALPIARTGHWEHTERPGERWVLTLAVLSQLEKSRQLSNPGLTVEELRLLSSVPPDALDDILEQLTAQGIIGCISSEGQHERYALICDPATVPVEWVSRAAWFDISVVEGWSAQIRGASGPLKSMNEQFLSQPRLIDWIRDS